MELLDVFALHTVFFEKCAGNLQVTKTVLVWYYRYKLKTQRAAKQASHLQLTNGVVLVIPL
jgi:hypothetical protein